MKEALLWERSKDSKVQCNLCGHRCLIQDGNYGVCGVRKNEKGTLYSLNYGRLIATNIDPIEKKPVFHFLPGSTSVSIASAGCNFHCPFCQNYSISQIKKGGIPVTGEVIEAKEIVNAALKSSQSISYTYTEPTIYFEYVYECSKLAKDKKIKNVWVTNGFMTEEAIEMIYPYMDAANVDLKAFKEDTYKKILGGKLSVVLDSIKLLRRKGVWVEVTTLIVPGMNDSEEELKDIAKFLFETDPDLPWHVSRYHADYKYSARGDQTPVKILNRASEIGYEAGLHYVYSGNVWGDSDENTYCHSCKKLLVERYGFSVKKNMIKEGKCYNCATLIPGVWE